MDLKEYEIEIKKISNDARVKTAMLNEKYALSNSNIKIGDIVTDHIGSICVETISIYHDRIPSCIYTGICLTKSGMAFKSEKRRGVYQENFKKA